jgi:hypothetical protein
MLRGSDRLWALKGELRMPLQNVTGVERAAAEAHEWFKGIRAGGVHVPGVISAGRFHSRGQLVFWDVHHPDQAIAIGLRDETYNKLVVEVADPDAAVETVTAAIAS